MEPTKGLLITKGAIITDCHDKDKGSSADSRIATRFKTLFGGVTPTLIPIEAKTSELERGSIQAAMDLLDQIDASRIPGPRSIKDRMLILINSATRGETPLHRPNGSPFCWWWPDKYTLVVSTLDGPVLPRAKSLGLIPDGVVHEMSVEDVMAYAVHRRWVSSPEAERICKSQFRSYDFQPMAAKWILENRGIPSRLHVVPEYVPDDITVLYADGFGNLTLNVTPEEFGYVAGAEITLADDRIALCVPSLKDVPQSHTDMPILALTIGSNGIRDPETGSETRFMELVIMQGSAQEYTGLGPGDTAILAKHVPANQCVS
jgi:hypothetical protein